MAIVRVTPTEVEVSTGLFDGRPRSIRMARERVPVIEIANVRDELAAYPIERGPRRIFEVRTPDARLRLSFEKRASPLAPRGPRGSIDRHARPLITGDDATIAEMVGSPQTFASLTLAEFSDRLASADPVPGGGSASAIAASIAASLVAMVARLSLDRPKYEPYRATNERALAVAEAARGQLLALADEDARAYGGFAAARKMPHETAEAEAARVSATQVAARDASEVPLGVVRECGRLLEEIAALAGRSNLNAASDLEVAGRLSAAAAHGAAANVMINLPMVGDERYAGGTRLELNTLLRDVDRTLARVAQYVGRGTLRSPGARLTHVTARVLEGRVLAAQIRSSVRRQAGAFQRRYGYLPTLAAVMVGRELASSVYVQQIIRTCAAVGVPSRVIELPRETTADHLRATIEALNNDREVAGDHRPAAAAAPHSAVHGHRHDPAGQGH